MILLNYILTISCLANATDGTLTPLLITNAAGDFVESEALVPLDGGFLIVVLPRGEDEQLTTSAGFHSCAAWFGKIGEAVFLQVNQRKASVESGAHHSLLARRDAGRDKHGTLLGSSKALDNFCVYFLLCEAARALHLQLIGMFKQETVANGRERDAGSFHIALHSKQVGVLAFHQQAARVVV